MDRDEELAGHERRIRSLEAKVAAFEDFFRGLAPAADKSADKPARTPSSEVHVVEHEGRTYIFSGEQDVAQIHRDVQRLLDREKGQLPFPDPPEAG